jgi:hypothetical protein
MIQLVALLEKLPMQYVILLIFHLVIWNLVEAENCLFTEL